MKFTLFFIIFLITLSESFSDSRFILKGALKKKLAIIEKNHSEDVTSYDQETNNEFIMAQNAIQKIFFNDLKPISMNATQNESSRSLFTKILEELLPVSEELGKLLSGEIKEINKKYDLGVKNIQGFQWQKPFGFFKVYTQREIQKVFINGSYNWKSTDNFIVEIDAQSFLKKLIDHDLLELGEGVFDLYAGIKYTKKFKTEHFYKTYDEALISDYKKHFTPFMFFLTPDLDKLEDYTKTTLEDLLVFNAGLNFSYQWYFLDLGVKADFEFSHERSTELYKQSPWKVIISKTRKTQTSTSASANLGAALTSLIKLSLFEFGYNNRTKLGYQKKYEFNPISLKVLEQESSTTSKFLLGEDLTKNEAYELGKNLISYEKEKNNQKDSNIDLLFYKQTSSSQSREIVISKEGETTQFKRETLYNKNLHRTFIGALKKGFLGNTLSLLGQTPKKMIEKSVSIEYQKNKKSNMSISISKKIINKLKTKKDYIQAKELLENQTNLYGYFISSLENKRLSQFIEISQNIDISPNFIHKFITSNQDFLEKRIKGFCEKSKKRKCFKKINRHLSKILKDLKQNDIISIERMKYFFKYVIKYSSSIKDLENFLGTKNIHLNGLFRTKIDKTLYTSPFNLGKFVSEDVIQKFYSK